MGQIFDVDMPSPFAETLHQKYEVQEIRAGRRVPLASGTMGEVWPATYRQTQELRACKSIRKVNATPAQVENEIAMLRSLHHENVVRFFESFNATDRYHIILECCLDNLEDVLDAANCKLRDVTIIQRWTMNMVSAIHYLHRNSICHRDVKPANFLIDKRKCIKLGDFGLAIRQTRGLTEVVGTQAFISCEMHRILMGHRMEYGIPADMWAVGIICFIMFTNYHPFCKTPPKSMLKTLHSMADFMLEPLNLSGELNMQQLFNDEVEWPYALRGAAIPDEAKGFVESCLLPMPDQRLTAAEAMQSEWLGGRLAARKIQCDKRLVPYGSDGWTQYEVVPHGNNIVDPLEANWPADPREGCIFRCMYNVEKQRRFPDYEFAVSHPAPKYGG